MLIEENQLSDADLPVDELKTHLRLGTGFSQSEVQDPVLVSFIAAAIAAIEARTGKILMERGFVWALHDWRDPARAVLPVAPVTSIVQVTIIDRFGAAETVDDGRYRLERDLQVPTLRPTGGGLPRIPDGGSAEVRLIAGYGLSFSDLPGDLRQAVLLLAAHYYEYRNETALGQGCMPFGVTSLIARYRAVRLGFGA
ncbi:hypothetical protein GCM10011415_08530 [Salipiger pallidus]|uniref:Phage gp6-like head-tail connector protein n=2 Tax=Salipiger pallidus TaxID=1775170 RepID=A0A8J3EFH7_9RHOB|nr:hypothetical protein GCM10011415_08530 [Salipiger pallidus]